MFDVGFSELIVIAIVALVVIGPERLPKVARTAGHLLGRLQRYVNDVKADINREMQLDELKKLQAEVQESARQLEHSVNSEMQSAQQAIKQTADGLDGRVEVPAAGSTSGVPSGELAQQPAEGPAVVPAAADLPPAQKA